MFVHFTLGFTYLHLSVSIFVRVTTALALPAKFLQLGLAALDGLRFRPPLTLILLQGGLIGKQKIYSVNVGGNKV